MQTLATAASSLALLAADAEAGNRTGWIALGIGVVVLLALLIVFLYNTRAGIIARATTKEAIRQPVFILLLLLSGALLVINTYTPFFSLGDDVKMLKDCGLATILISGLFLAIWTSSTSIADEIEGKTAMTLLSKPINRRQFVVGKYVGILTATLWLILPLAIMFLLLVLYKSWEYDPRESSKEADFATALREVIVVIPGLVLIFLEIAVMSAVSVAISTRVPMVVNMVTCLAIFVIGHLTPTLLNSSLERMEAVKFMAQVFATVLPALEAYNIQASIATGSIVPPVYLAWAAVYTAAFSTMAILLAFILFEDRDLA